VFTNPLGRVVIVMIQHATSNTTATPQYECESCLPRQRREQPGQLPRVWEPDAQHLGTARV